MPLHGECQVPRLPNELWRSIILEHAVPPAGAYEGSLERQRTLARWSRINRSFAWLQTHLFAEVRLETYQRAAAFLASIEAPETTREETRNTRLRQLVKTLRVGSEFEQLDRDPDGARFNLGDVLARLPELETLFLGRLHGLVLLMLFRAPKLKALHIWDCMFDRYPTPPPTSQPQIPSLERVTFHSGFDWITFRGEPDYHRDYPLFPSPLCPNLRAFHGDPVSTRVYRPPLLQSYAPVKLDGPITQQVAFLSCDIDALRPSVTDSTFPLSYLPRTVRFLRITSGHFFGRDFLTPYLVENRASALPLLEELVLPQRLSTSAAFEPLRDWATESGVRITYERDEESPGSIWDRGFWNVADRVERQLAEDRRLEDKEQPVTGSVGARGGRVSGAEG